MSPKLRDLGEPVFSFTDLSDGVADLGLDTLCTVAFTPIQGADESANAHN